MLVSRALTDSEAERSTNAEALRRCCLHQRDRNQQLFAAAARFEQTKQNNNEKQTSDRTELTPGSLPACLPACWSSKQAYIQANKQLPVNQPYRLSEGMERVGTPSALRAQQHHLGGSTLDLVPRELLLDSVLPGVTSPSSSSPASSDDPRALLRLACVSRTFRDLVYTPELLKKLHVTELLKCIAESSTAWGHGGESFVSAAAEAGNTEAQHFLGMVLVYTKEDYRGATLIAEAARKGHVGAMFSLSAPFWRAEQNNSSGDSSDRALVTLNSALRDVGSLGKTLEKSQRSLVDRTNITPVNAFLCAWNVRNKDHITLSREGLHYTPVCAFPGCGRRKIRFNSGCGLKIRLCSRCLASEYCSLQCQRMHWKSRHRHECSPWWENEQEELLTDDEEEEQQQLPAGEESAPLLESVVTGELPGGSGAGQKS